jgi:outer membrane protein OmpA-like peptidoglycan-associated protein
MRTLLSSLLFTFVVAGCHHDPAPVAPMPTPAPEATAAPTPETEPEAAPVVETPLKSLEIQKDVIRLKPGTAIKFGVDSDKLLPESNDILDEVVMVMSKNEKVHIRVEGHTDNTGDKNHNQDLSTRRAASVMAYLTSKGIAADRLDSTGCGQGTPIADNATEDGKATNRRVEFVIIHKHHPRANCELYKPGEHHHDHDTKAGAPEMGH